MEYISSSSSAKSLSELVYSYSSDSSVLSEDSIAYTALFTSPLLENFQSMDRWIWHSFEIICYYVMLMSCATLDKYTLEIIKGNDRKLPGNFWSFGKFYISYSFTLSEERCALSKTNYWKESRRNVVTVLVIGILDEFPFSITFVDSIKSSSFST